MKQFLSIMLLIFFTTPTVFAQHPKNRKDESDRFKEKLHFPQDYSLFLKQQQKASIKFPNRSKNFGNAPDWNWTKTYGGSGIDYANDLIADSNGNYYLAGTFSGEISCNGTTFTSQGLRDGFVAKFDDNRNMLWLKQIQAAPTKRVVLNGIALGVNDTLYATGYFSGNLDVGAQTLTGTHEQNLLFLKLDNSGNIMLAGRHNAQNEAEAGKAILADTDGNFYVLAAHDVLKYNASGTLQWEIAEQEEVFNDFLLLDQKLYYAGYITENQGTIDTAGYHGNGFYYSDMFWAQSNLDGHFTKVKVPVHTQAYGNESEALSIESDAHKNLYIGGTFGRNPGNDLIMDTVSITVNIDRYQGFLMKMDTTGTAHWGKALDYQNPSAFTTGADSISYVTIENSVYKYDHTGALSNSKTDLNYTPKALHVNQLNSYLLTAGISSGSIYFSALDNSLAQNFQKTFSNNFGSAKISGMDADSLGNIYIVGNVRDSISYEGQPVQEGVFFAKQDENGQLFWLKQIPNAQTPETSLGDIITIDPGNTCMYFSGFFEEDITPPGGTTLTPDADGSVFLLKYDLSGTFMDSWQFDGLEKEGGDLTVDYAGNLIFSHVFRDTIQVNGTQYYSKGELDVITLKLNTSGNMEWVAHSGGNAQEYSGMTAVDSSNHIYFTGEFTSTGNVKVFDQTLVTTQEDGHIVLTKLTPTGQTQWVKLHGGAASTTFNFQNSQTWPTDIKTLPDGCSYIKGWHGDSVAFSDTMLVNAYEGLPYNYFIGKFNPSGEAIWVNSIEEKLYGFDYNQMDIDSAGNVYWGAQIRDTIYFKHPSQTYEYQPQGLNDLFVARYSSTGQIEWIKTMQSRLGYNYLSAVAVSDSNHVYASGYYKDYLGVGTADYYAEPFHAFITRIGYTPQLTPDQLSLTSDTIMENLPVGTQVGLFQITQDDRTEYAFSLVDGDGSNDADNNKFTISGDTLLSSQEFDFETQNKMYIYVQAQSTLEQQVEKGFIVKIADVDEASAISTANNAPFRVYPNPASRYLTIAHKEPAKHPHTWIKIFSAEGKLLHQQRMKTTDTRIDLSQMPRGIYAVKIQTATTTYQYKLIKE